MAVQDLIEMPEPTSFDFIMPLCYSAILIHGCIWSSGYAPSISHLQLWNAAPSPWLILPPHGQSYRSIFPWHCLEGSSFFSDVHRTPFDLEHCWLVASAHVPHSLLQLEGSGCLHCRCTSLVAFTCRVLLYSLYSLLQRVGMSSWRPSSVLQCIRAHVWLSFEMLC